MKQNNKKNGFLGMLLGTLGVSLLGYMLAGKGVIRGRKISGGEKIRGRQDLTVNSPFN